MYVHIYLQCIIYLRKTKDYDIKNLLKYKEQTLSTLKQKNNFYYPEESFLSEKIKYA